ncbi:MAG: asparagine synthase-related protein [Saprospiraceae bacterium]
MKDFFAINTRNDFQPNVNLFLKDQIKKIEIANFQICFSEFEKKNLYCWSENGAELYLLGNPILLNGFLELINSIRIREYIDNFEKIYKLFERINGIAAFMILDKVKNEIHFINDPLGYYPIFIYEDADRLIVTNSIKTLMFCNDINLEWDSNSIINYLNNGFFISGRTWYKNCRKLEPALVLSLSLNSGTLSQINYWTWQNCQKSDQTKESLILDYIDTFNNSFEELPSSQEKIGIALSGGLDSRWVASNLAKRKINLESFTFSNGKSVDLNLAEKISKLLKIPWRTFQINEKNWFEDRLLMFWEAGGLIPINHFHEGNIYTTLSKDYEIVATGFYGGGIYSSEKYLNQRINSTISKKLIQFCNTSDLSSNHYFDIESIDPYLSYQKISNLAALHVYNMSKSFKVFLPFYNLKWLMVNYSIDEKLQSNSKFYLEVLIKELDGKLTDLAWQKTLVPLKYSAMNSCLLKYGLNKIIYSILSKIGFKINFVNYNFLIPKLDSLINKFSTPDFIEINRPKSIEQKFRYVSMLLWIQMNKKHRANVL